MTSANAWLKSLIKEPLPVLSSSRAEALRLLNDDRASLSDMARSFSRDPLLCHHIVTAAWSKQRAGGKDREIRTLEQALNLLGLKDLETKLKKLPVITEEDLKRPEVRHYLDVAMQSQYAAEQAYQWAIVQLWKAADEVWLAALLYSQLAWYVALRCAPKLAECQAALRAHEPALAIEKKLFGSPLITLAAQLTELLCPLETLSHAFDDKALPDVVDMAAISAGDPEAVRQWASRPAVWIAFANHMAGQAMSHGLDRHLIKRLSLISGLLRLSEDKTWEYLRTLAIKVSSETLLTTMTPAARLLMLPDRVRAAALTLPMWLDTKEPPAAAAVENPKPPSPPKATTPVTATKASTPPAPMTRQANVEVLKGFGEAFTRHSHEFADLHELMNFLALGLHYGAGLERVEILLLNPDRTALSSHYHAGLAPDSALRKLKMGVGNNPLLRKLLEAPVCLHIDAASAAKYWPHVPDPLKLALGRPEVVMMAMFLNDRPVALVIADRQGKPVAPGQREAVKRLTLQAMEGLKLLAAKRRPAMPPQKPAPTTRPAVPR